MKETVMKMVKFVNVKEQSLNHMNWKDIPKKVTL